MATTSVRVAALKEWAVTIRALDRGQQILLLRKGGISEERKEFLVEHEEFYLYPTYEHQREDLLKPAYHDDLRATLGESPGPSEVVVTNWARVAEVHTLTEPEVVDALSPFYIWTTSYAQERLHWRPRKPLHVLLVRVYRLVEPVRLPVRPEYGGCKSWLDLDPLPERARVPVLSDAAFATQAEAVRRVLQP